MDYKVYNKKYLIGDLHGYWSVIAQHITHNDEKNIAYLQVGDFNIGFNGDYEIDKLIQLNKILNDFECDLYIMRGNHDNPNWFKDENFIDVKAKFNRIRFVPDYTVINIDTENILFVGGAISIDRVPNKLVGHWWGDEVFPFDKKRLNALQDIERVITHTAPNFCEPLRFNDLVYRYAKNDVDLIKDLIAEREKVTEMATLLMNNGKNNLRGWYYGHFHNNYRLVHNNIEFVCLGIERFIQL